MCPRVKLKEKESEQSPRLISLIECHQTLEEVPSLRLSDTVNRKIAPSQNGDAIQLHGFQ